jgi:vacuolar protein sorting-associated protein 13A/C
MKKTGFFFLSITLFLDKVQFHSCINPFFIFFFTGDVVLRNLVLKQSALSELDLPVQTSYGHLGSLVLKIPWKNLYSAPVEAYIDRLYLLAVPNNSVRYNAEREDKNVFEAKKAELERIQLAKKLENEKSE